jgi:DNA polymerase III epsilon subunit-like protein
MPVHNNIIVYDFETGSANPHETEPIQLAACVIDPYRLQIVEGEEFSSMMLALEPDKLEEGALRVNKKTREEIAAAPHPELVWKQFTAWCKQFGLRGKNDKWSAPIAAGHNILSFDNIITQRYCEKYGPTRSDGSQGLFHGIYAHDTLQIHNLWFATQKYPAKYNMDELRGFYGLDKEGGHDALVDVRQTAQILLKFLQLHKDLAGKIKFRDAFGPHPRKINQLAAPKEAA